MRNTVRTYLRSLRAPLNRSLGTCPRCMHAAFLVMIGTIAAAGMATALLGQPFASAAWLIAFLAALLWVAHIFMFALRWIRSSVVGDDKPLSAADSELWPRRRVVGVLLQLMVFTAAATMLPKSARAATACNCMLNCSCDDPAFPQCVFNPSRNESTCCGPNQTGCASPYRTYCCPPGRSCYGDGSSAPYCH